MDAGHTVAIISLIIWAVIAIVGARLIYHALLK